MFFADTVREQIFLIFIFAVERLLKLKPRFQYLQPKWLSMKMAFFLLAINLPILAFAQLPACKDSFPKTLFPNNSFEEYPGCVSDYGGTYEGGGLGTSDQYELPGWQAVWRNSGVIYHNSNCRLNTTASIFDSTIFCHSPVKVPLPLPSGRGFIEIGQSSSQVGSNEINSGKSYIGTCLAQPLYAGQPYTFSF